MRKKSKSYKVGRGKPPVAHRFKKGKSGNPRGRPNGARNFSTLLDRELNSRITIEQGGKVKKLSRREALAKGLVNDSLKGRDRAREKLLDYVERSDSSRQSRATREEVSQKDREIIERFLERNKADDE
jgi:hypothetical protein